jgi:hypothetical protein
VTGVEAFRLRVGDFRVIFSETAETITILEIGPRGGRNRSRLHFGDRIRTKARNAGNAQETS